MCQLLLLIFFLKVLEMFVKKFGKIEELEIILNYYNNVFYIN